jgi:phosphatidylglycerophosphatase A
MSGTFGTLGGLLYVFFIHRWGGIVAMILSLAILLPVSVWSVRLFSTVSGVHDSSEIVIDEIIGLWIAFLPFSAMLSMPSIFGQRAVDLMPAPEEAAILSQNAIAWGVIIFVIFRFFDMTKIWPASYYDKKSDFMSIIMDDVVAGFYTALVMILLWYFNTDAIRNAVNVIGQKSMNYKIFYIVPCAVGFSIFWGIMKKLVASLKML